jgi:PKD repeat protein
VGPRTFAVAVAVLVASGVFVAASADPPVDASMCRVTRSFELDPRGDARAFGFVPDRAGTWSLSFESHGLVGMGLDVFESTDPGGAPIHSERISFGFATHSPARSEGIPVAAGLEYWATLTPIGRPGAWATCAQSFVSSDGHSGDGSPDLVPRAGQPPKPAFAFSPALPVVGEPVTFDASGSRDDGAIVSYAWTFGDGSTGSGQIALHAYATHGSFTVTLTVTDDSSRTASVSKIVRVAIAPSASFTFSPLVPRAGDPVAFDASASRDPDGTALSYAWTWGDGTTSTVTSPLTTHVYALHGTYRAELRVTDADGLASDASARISVFAGPTADFTFSPAEPVVASAVTFDASTSQDPDSAIISYAWDFGDGASGSGRITSHSFGTAGTYSVLLRVTGSDGFSSSASKSVRVRAPPVPSFAYTPADPTARKAVTFDASATTDPDGTVVAYEWAFGDGGQASGVVVTHTYAQDGTFAVSLTVTDSDGLRASLTRSVVVAPYVPIPPVVTFTIAPENPLAGQPVAFDGRATYDPDGTIASYAWSSSDGGSGTASTWSRTFAVAGTYMITLTVTDNDGEWAAASRSLRVRAAPIADFGFSPAVPIAGQTITFDASASRDPDGSIVSYAWVFGDGTTGSGRIAAHAYVSYGSYTVALTVTDSDGLTARITKTVRVLAAPSAGFTFTPLSPKVGDMVSFDASASSDPDGPIASYAWDFGDGSSGTGRTAGHAYPMHGTYRVSLLVTDADGLVAEAFERVTVFAPPTADFTFAPPGPLPGTVVSFDASASSDPDSSIVSYTWAFGDGASGSGRLATHAYATHGSFTVRLTVTGSDGLTGTISRTVRVLARPGASFTFSPSKPVEGQVTTFDASASSDPDGTIVSYAWTFGDGTTGSGRVVTHTYARYGTYVVALTVSDSDGLTGSTSLSVRILGRPIASFSYLPEKPLRGQSVAFDASASSDPDGTVASYAWTFGDGIQGTGRTVSHAYASHGTFTVTLTVTDNEGVTGTTSRAVRIYAPPTAAFVYSPAGPLEGTSVSFDASGSTDPDGAVVSFAWDWGDGTISGPSSSATAAHTFARYGTYAVRLTVTDGDGFTGTTTTNVRILARPVASFTTSPAKPLAGQAVSFDASASSDPDGTVSSYAWAFGDGGIGTGRTASHPYAAYGTYTVTLTVTDSDGLTASTTRSIRIYAPPSPSFTFTPAKPLAGQSVSFDGSASTDPDGTITSYAWDFGDGGTGTGSTRAHTYAAYGTYAVRLTVVDSDGFSASTTKSVRIHAVPTAAFSFAPAKPLAGTSVSFDGSSSSDPDGTIATYRWTWGDGTTTGPSAAATAAHTFAQFGSYVVTLRVTDADGFTGETSKTVRIHASPVASFVVTPASPVRGQPATFDGSASNDPDGTIATYRWTWGDGTTSATLSSPTATHTYDLHGTYTVVLQVTDSDGFTASASKSVRVVSPPSASFTFDPASPSSGQNVNFNGAGSSDADGTITSYAWDFGDTRTGTGVSATHIYLGGGNYTVTLTVTDSDGLTGSASRVVPVRGENRPPTAGFTLSRALMTASVDASVSTDPEGTIVGYAWAWGDGTTGSGRTASHGYGTAGAYTITLTITDGGGLTSTASQVVSVGPWTLDLEFYDFFNVPYGEWWDYRTPTWGDLPMEAECFNATAIANGVCVASVSGVPDAAAYPYTGWYPTPGATEPYDVATNAQLFAPYRVRAAGDQVPGYTLGSPVFLPVREPAQAPGALLEFDWRAQYVDTALVDSLSGAGCPIGRLDLDGFVVRSVVTLRMDLQESRRLFGVVGADANAARSWWSSSIAAGCAARGAAETAWQDFMVQQGGSSTMIGVYDVMNGFGWWYSPFYTAFTATVASDGITTVVIDHAAWGTDVLLARWFHWGAASYRDNHLDSSRRAGWWGMEPRALEGIAFRGTLASTSMDFALDAVVPYHMREDALPGVDGTLNRVGDVPRWSWGASLADIIAGPNNPIEHTASELNRYPDGTYTHSTPGSQQYAILAPYDYVPATWNLPAGHTWLFRFPTGAVAFHDPNTTPIGADPVAGEYVQTAVPLRFAATFPGPIGTWDAASGTWRVYGPMTTGGPIGTPSGGYPAEPYPSVRFTP